MNINALKTVYSYYFPEVDEIMQQTATFPSSLYRVSTMASEAERDIQDVLQLATPLKVTKNSRGLIDLDNLHKPIIDRIANIYARSLIGLDGFKNAYPLSGSSPGIFHLLAELQSKGIEKIHVLDGEYEGYGAYASFLGLEIVTVTEDEALDTRGEVFFVSNPSARDGNIIHECFVRELCELGNQVVLDAAYVGMTRAHEFDVSHPNIIAVLVSLSKPYGLFRFRIGFCFSRQPIDSLYASKWFKDIERLLQALKIVETLPPGSLYERYVTRQESIVGRLNKLHDLNLEPSDTLLLAHQQKPSSNVDLGMFERGDGYRLCLTPEFELTQGSRV